ncbi:MULTISPECIES: thiosulfate sulfurtransferase GlpE [unclassified Shewanella]|jgi:thiosulfate sulfurtransferase|uniref:thiosulfate sulfurtransferase GlpE n=1 Tax=unclassified Shewanella TaxID=196818 RepID=UPI000C32C511|nr:MULTISPECIES: thiosulfate sulfurtransferase GlpE [unclassified Shewanella]MBB1364422.1 thiosulfate sulfurtransferase GlpE [Shewanella sp. SR44-4]MBO1897870.1 thiosulfate sulfurtransferase GlpE [Shewanella sp. BF02_Schw]PKH28448.1 thiosulfate sulfurtransferase GlpE [Shewanella sp. ALD9]
MSGFKHLSINELIHMSTESNDIQVVDIRDAASFAAGHIEGATHLSNENLADFIGGADMDKPVVVVCYHGMSSQSAASYLNEQGFDDIYSLDGGYSAWSLAHA